MHSHLRKETSEILFSSSTVPRHFTPNAGRMDNAVDQVRHALTVGRSGPRRLHSCGVGLVESPSVSVVKSWSIPPDRLSYQGGKVMTAPAEHTRPCFINVLIEAPARPLLLQSSILGER
jgi:hypothetical protein